MDDRCPVCGAPREERSDSSGDPCPRCAGTRLQGPEGAGGPTGGVQPTVLYSGSRPPGPAARPVSSPAGRYIRREVLGAGGMGTVWKAWDSQLERTVALKEIRSYLCADPDVRERFRREAQVVARLRHPHVVSVHDIGMEGERPYLTMDFVEGTTYARWLVASGSGPAGVGTAAERLRRRIRILADVAEAVGHAHRQGIVHRDLKPANILIDAEERAYVTDFGLACELRKMEEESGEGPRRTRVGQLLGTPAYMSPEMAAGTAVDAGPPVDVWALGVILYEILAGVLPFQGETTVSWIAAVLEAEIVPPSRWAPETPPALEAICLRALERDLARRTPDAGALAEDLRRWLRGEPVTAAVGERGDGLWNAFRRRPRTLRTAAAGLLALAILVAWAGVESAVRARQRDAALAEVAGRAMLFWHEIWTREVPEEVQNSLARQPLGTLDRMIEDDPAFGPALAWRGWVRLVLGEDKRAAEDFDRACRVSPDHAIVWCLRGAARLEWYGRLRSLPLPERWVTDVVFHPAPPETETQAELREQGLEDLRRMETAPIPGGLPGEEFVRVARAEALLLAGGGEAYEEVLRRVEGLDTPKAHKVSGVALYYLGRFDEAIDAFDRTLREWPEDPYSRAYRAEATLASALGKSARGVDARESLMRAIGDFEAVLRMRRGDLSLRNDLAWTRIMLGGEEERRGGDPRSAFRRAIEDLDAVLEADPGHVLGRYRRGMAWMSLALADSVRGMDPEPGFASAEADFREALLREPLLAGARNCRGRILVRRAEMAAMRGDDPEPGMAAAMAELDEGIRGAPGEPGHWAGRGVAWSALGEIRADRGREAEACFERALADYSEALAREPGTATYLHDRGLAHTRQGVARIVLGRDPGDAFVLALADYDRALAVDPGMPHAYENRGTLHRFLAAEAEERGEDPMPHFERGLRDLNESLRRQPDEWSAYLSRGGLRTRWGDAEAVRRIDARATYRAAMADLDRAVAGAGTDSRPHLQRGLTGYALAAEELRHGGDPGALMLGALADVEEAVRRSPRDPRALMSRARLEVGMSRLEEVRGGGDPSARRARAELDLRAAIEVGYAPAWFDLAAHLLLVGRFAEAADAFDSGAAAVPSRAEWARAEANDARWRAEVRGSGYYTAWGEGHEAIRGGDYAGARERYLAGLAELFASLDRLPEPERRLRMSRPWLRTILSEVHYNLACVEAVASTGRSTPEAQGTPLAPGLAESHRQGALAALERAVEFGFDDAGFLRADEDLAPLRGLAAFEELARRLERR